MMLLETDAILEPETEKPPGDHHRAHGAASSGQVTPSMRVSAPVTLPKPSDKPARKPYKARGSAASGLPDPQAMPGQAATTAI